jgi:hypothetical protein
MEMKFPGKIVLKEKEIEDLIEKIKGSDLSETDKKLVIEVLQWYSKFLAYLRGGREKLEELGQWLGLQRESKKQRTKGKEEGL